MIYLYQDRLASKQEAALYTLSAGHRMVGDLRKSTVITGETQLPTPYGGNLPLDNTGYRLKNVQQKNRGCALRKFQIKTI